LIADLFEVHVPALELMLRGTLDELHEKLREQGIRAAASNDNSPVAGCHSKLTLPCMGKSVGCATASPVQPGRAAASTARSL
jgi:hypothetical protein